MRHVTGNVRACTNNCNSKHIFGVMCSWIKAVANSMCASMAVLAGACMAEPVVEPKIAMVMALVFVYVVAIAVISMGASIAASVVSSEDAVRLARVDFLLLAVVESDNNWCR